MAGLEDQTEEITQKLKQKGKSCRKQRRGTERLQTTGQQNVKEESQKLPKFKKHKFPDEWDDQALSTVGKESIMKCHSIGDRDPEGP